MKTAKQAEKITRGVKAFRETADGRLFTGGIGGSLETEWFVGQTVELENDEPLELCSNGFHFYREKDACFGVDLFGSNTVFYSIEAYGEVLSDTEKCVCRKINILERLDLVLDGHQNSGHQNSGDRNSGDRNSGDRNSGHQNSGHQNSGHQNSGDRNSGDRNSGDRNSGHQNSGHQNSGHQNSGDRNSGDRNSGNWNSGDRNSGDWNSGYRNSGYRNSGYRNSGDGNSGDQNSGNWNSGDWNSGHLNSNTPTHIRVFNQECPIEAWQNAKKPALLFFSMADGESYKDAFRRSWKAAPQDDRDLLEKLPNFDWDVFTEISGIEKPVQ